MTSMDELKRTALVIAAVAVLGAIGMDAMQQADAYISGDVYDGVVTSKGRTAGVVCGVIVRINGWERAVMVTPQTYVRVRVGDHVKVGWADNQPVILRGTEGDVQRRKAAIETIMEAINRWV